jgi:hypothetical protein
MARRIAPADITAGLRLGWRLPRLFRHPVTVGDSRQVLRRRLERREHDFLTLVRHAIYEHPPSPHRALLRLAGPPLAPRRETPRMDR